MAAAQRMEVARCQLPANDNGFPQISQIDTD